MVSTTDGLFSHFLLLLFFFGAVEGFEIPSQDSSFQRNSLLVLKRKPKIHWNWNKNKSFKAVYSTICVSSADNTLLLFIFFFLSLLFQCCLYRFVIERVVKEIETRIVFHDRRRRHRERFIWNTLSLQRTRSNKNQSQNRKETNDAFHPDRGSLPKDLIEISFSDSPLPKWK